MPTQDQTRIEQDRARPRLMELWWALRPLTSVVRFMQTGAHPDDEISGMLAALAFRDGLNLSYACSTRGEGGQNDIGTEAGSDLGALRTREMERACDVLGMRLYWHSTAPDDTITDFGFSKSGTETLQRWGRDRTLHRFVEIVRAEKPDIICPTFLDVPGQHGHHRAMTEAAHAMMDAAADPEFPCDLPVWSVKKLYLPAWSGAGQAYDDDLPPPPATLSIAGGDRETMTGWNWDRMGQQSRAYHRTQGMGRWIPAGSVRNWPLHLAQSRVAGPDTELWSGLARKLSDLAVAPAAAPISTDLTQAQDAIDAAIAAFPDFDAVAEHAARALQGVSDALAGCPQQILPDYGHRLAAKQTQLAHVLKLALGVDLRVRSDRTFVDPGAQMQITTEIDQGSATDLQTELVLPTGWTGRDTSVALDHAAAPTDPYRAFYDPIAPEAPCLRTQIFRNDVPATVLTGFETEPVVLPSERVALSPATAIINTKRTNRMLALTIAELYPLGATVTLSLPSGWAARRHETGFEITLPAEVAPGLYRIEALVNGAPAQTVRIIDHDHVGPTATMRPAVVTVGVFDVTLPDSKVGYIGAGNDRVAHWLRAMGADVVELDDMSFASDNVLAEFDAIVVGIFAMRFRAGLVEAMPALHRWTAAGGTLVTLYHRPWDNWDPDTVPPRRLEIGQPSLRWRVTDENAHVHHLHDHAILNTPNLIGPADWDGWVKERGLYFAKVWDADYVPLLSMADPGEVPLTGGLLAADIGKGRHIHTSLILHHQMEHLVPGAFRLMANFVSRRQ